MMKKIKDNALAFTLMGGLLTVAFGAWFGMEAKFTPMKDHQALAGEVQQTGLNLEELKIRNDLRWFQSQYWNQCRSPQQRSSQQCQWLASQIQDLKLQLQQVRGR